MTAPQPPKGLKSYGQLLWDNVTASTKFDPSGYYLLGEACRTADIIERLSGMLNSNSTEWLALSDDAVQYATADGGDIASINLVVNPVLGEVRQQRLALRQILAQLKLGVTEANTDDDDPIARMMAEFQNLDKEV